MKRERLFRNRIRQLGRVTVDYYLTVDDDSPCEKYGVCLVKITDDNLIEEFAYADRIWQEREQAEVFIEKLAQGAAMPVTLSDIIDDYLNK